MTRAIICPEIKPMPEKVCGIDGCNHRNQEGICKYPNYPFCVDITIKAIKNDIYTEDSEKKRTQEKNVVTNLGNTNEIYWDEF